MPPCAGARAVESEGPVLHWRGIAWRLRAVDGWHRVGDPWWEQGAGQVSCGQGSGWGEPGRAESSRAQMPVDPMRPSAATVHEAHVGSRICIGDGLWMSIRWPARLSVRPHGAGDTACRDRHVPRVEQGYAHGCRRTSMCEHGHGRKHGHEPQERTAHGLRPGVFPRMASLAGHSPEALSCEAWLIGAADVFRHGVRVTVHGVWS
jgi:hypothetical protein